MFPLIILAAATRELARKLGVAAFIVVGLVDQSVVPIPGSIDALVILFTAKKPELWWYYALWATAGTTLGGYLTYRIAKKGGQEALEGKLGKRRAEKAYHFVGRWGFWSIFIGVILPPPVPIVPLLATAGVMQYPKQHFLAAYISGRILRFSVVAWVTREYGKHIFRFFARYYDPVLYSLIALAVVAGIVGIWFYLRFRRRKEEEAAGRRPERRVA